MKLKITAYHRGMLYPCYGGMPNGGLAMHHTEKYKNYDELKGRFTVWLEKVVRNAKINYIKKLKREPQLVYLEEIPESVLTTQSSSYEVYTKSEFEFEEERLSKAFSKLPLMRKRILTMLFVENISPDEISKRLNCSPQYVYNQRYKALKALKNELDKGGER